MPIASAAFPIQGKLPQCGRLLAGHNLWRHQPDVIHIGRASDIDDFGYV
jgi:hypothetical protein